MGAREDAPLRTLTGATNATRAAVCSQAGADVKRTATSGALSVTDVVPGLQNNEHIALRSPQQAFRDTAQHCPSHPSGRASSHDDQVDVHAFGGAEDFGDGVAVERACRSGRGPSVWTNLLHVRGRRAV